MEDVVGWALGKDVDAAKSIRDEYPDAPNFLPEIVAWLKRETREKGAKTDFVVHEAITSAILRSKIARTRIRSLLEGLVQIATNGDTSGFAERDAGRSTANCAVWRVKCES